MRAPLTFSGARRTSCSISEREHRPAALGERIDRARLEGDETLGHPARHHSPALSFACAARACPACAAAAVATMIIMVNVAVPTHLSEDQRRLFTDTGRHLGENIKPQREKGLMDRFREALGL